MQLTEHFRLSELTASAVAIRKGISNSPPPGVLENLRYLAKFLEAVRSKLGDVPLHVSSGYRCPAVNVAIGGAKNSAHLQGLAADFVAPAFGSPKEIAMTLSRSHLQFDQLIHEGNWVHIAIAPSVAAIPRRQIMTAHFGGGGVVRYTAGIS